MADVHKIDVTGFAGLTACEVASLLEDGRFAFPVLNKLIPKWYPTLKQIDDPYITFVDTAGNPYLLRMFTNGLKFMPSKQLGTGRKFDSNETLSKGQKLTVICAGFGAHSEVWTSFIPFLKLIEEYPLAMIPAQDKRYIQSLHE